MKVKAHFIAPELLNPANPIEVCLIGAGGTGSQVLTALARMSHSLIALGHAGFQVTVYDDDVITAANMGRQLFAPSEVGLYKSAALVLRCNRFFGSGWKAVPKQFGEGNSRRAAIYISCTDSAVSRFFIADALQQPAQRKYYDNFPRYWMDFGNAKQTGQVILSTIGSIEQPPSGKYCTVERMPFITDEFPELLRQGDAHGDAPSCSLAEALEKQDLFINSALAQVGCSLLWQLFRNGYTTQRGVFLNLEDFRSAGLPL